jgi:hypothetical protein
MGLRRLILGLLVLCSGCRSASIEPAVDRLSGTWRWIEASGGIAGFRYTPTSLNYNVELRFAGAQLTALRNDSVKSVSTVTIRGDEVTFQPPVSVFTFHSRIETQRLASMSADTLVLSDPCCDMFSYVFVRVR